MLGQPGHRRNVNLQNLADLLLQLQSCASESCPRLIELPAPQTPSLWLSPGAPCSSTVEQVSPESGDLTNEV